MVRDVSYQEDDDGDDNENCDDDDNGDDNCDDNANCDYDVCSARSAKSEVWMIYKTGLRLRSLPPPHLKMRPNLRRKS